MQPFSMGPSVTFKIAEFPPNQVVNDKIYFIKDGRVCENHSEDLDASFILKNEVICFCSTHAYFKAPVPTSPESPFKYFIDSSLHDLNLYLGRVNLNI